MRLRRWLAVAVVLTFCARPGRAQAVRYEVSVASAAAHLFHVKAEFPTGGTDTLLVSLPAWSPGQLRDPELRALRAPLRARRTPRGNRCSGTGSTRTPGASAPAARIACTVAFDFLADAIDLSRARLVADFGQFLGTNLFLYQEGHLERPAEVRFALPAGWAGDDRAARAAATAYRAADYHELADAADVRRALQPRLARRWTANGSGSRSGPRPTTRRPSPAICATGSRSRPPSRTG